MKTYTNLYKKYLTQELQMAQKREGWTFEKAVQNEIEEARANGVHVIYYINWDENLQEIIKQEGTRLEPVHFLDELIKELDEEQGMLLQEYLHSLGIFTSIMFNYYRHEFIMGWLLSDLSENGPFVED